MKNEMVAEEIIKNLIRSAFEVRENAYAFYSHFAVGAAVLSDDGGVYTGCNIENASYPAGSCAETVAINKAVSEGARGIRAIAIVGGPEGKEDEEQASHVNDYIYPCGICRQVLSEFRGKDGTVVILAKSADDYKLYDFSELMVGAFTSEALSGQADDADDSAEQGIDPDDSAE